MFSLTKASSVACVLLACLTFSSITQALPVPASDKETASRLLGSRSPDARMIPNAEDRDLVTSLFNSLGFSDLADLNHWKSDNEPVIDDSNSPDRTETTQDNTVDDNGTIRTDDPDSGDKDKDEDKNKGDKDKGDKNSTEKDSQNDGQLPNPATDPTGFVTALMQKIQHTVNEALDSSDEHTLN
ncbi:uncharacterized protein BO80DRAFT_429611 [Aspergillus ibericus CBS 121593]|uniref:Uncharacterized protein n=1 Tax=Aspergillus ibericus CBS 121593 TaxID=1448316 RepID=A0A395GKE7_9EURO|nr:hypothetical protein BO80DRAFT_429611 [Aspergillus ibericus CBS 121593]RAK95772.1 hypothetical protein BO80DRAFT_429611 [Aspergillus ibericus CBS 121593]